MKAATVHPALVLLVAAHVHVFSFSTEAWTPDLVTFPILQKINVNAMCIKPSALKCERDSASKY